MTYFISRILFYVFILTSLQAVADNTAIAEKVEKMSSKYDKKYLSIKHVTVSSYLKSPQKWILVDVRTEKERKISIIPGAITKEMLEHKLADYKDKRILLYCTVGDRSSAYAIKLLEQGCKHVSNLRGGVLAWALAGKKFVTPGNSKTRKVHVYAVAWNILPPNYIGFW